MTSYSITDLRDILLYNKEYVFLVWLDIKGVNSGYAFYKPGHIFQGEGSHWVVKGHQVYHHADKRVALLKAIVFGYVP